jgi:hypothetical protein
MIDSVQHPHDVSYAGCSATTNRCASLGVIGIQICEGVSLKQSGEQRSTFPDCFALRLAMTQWG